MRTGVLTVLALVAWGAPALAGEKKTPPKDPPPIRISVQPETIVNGGVFLVEIRGEKVAEGVTLRWANREVPAHVDGETASALLGVNVAVKPGPYHLTVTAGDYQTKHRIVVADARYPVERLTLPKNKVSGFSKETLQRIKKDKAAMDAIWDATTEERIWDGGWIWPVEGKITSSFGKRRIINGDPRSPHSGTDHRAKTGTPIRAAHHGTVVLTGDQFFAGNCVILDHGHGLYSMYFHLSRTDVKVGDKLEQGDVIGKVGATGRASGPHLHWGVRLLNARVDPERLLALLPKKEEPAPPPAPQE